LYNIHKSYVIKAAKEEDAEKKAAFEILAEALKAPLYQILKNAGLDAEEIYSKCKSGPTYGYNVKTNKYGYMTTMGVIDPVKVTRQALQNAVSVAVTILSTNAIITMARA
jgi:chaperonin GroEL